MKLKVAGGSSEVQVSDETFGLAFNESLVHQVITAYRNAARSGSKAQLTKAEVRGGGRKPRPQKGGGTSRAGSIRSPIWVGGGRAFAAKPRSFEQKVNRKMYRGALRSMLSELVRQDRLVVTDGIVLEAPKTKQLVTRLQSMSLGHAAGSSVLIVVEAIDEKLFLAARNLPHVDVLPASALNPLALASHEKVLMTVGAVKMIDTRMNDARVGDAAAHSPANSAAN
jgi:large subunit ribosomal protein L4